MRPFSFRRLVLTAAIGAVLGFLVESVHRWAGVWALSDGATVPWWIAVVYFAGLLGCGAGLHAVEARVAPSSAPTRRELGAEMLLLGALVLAPALLHAHEVALTALALGYLIGRLALWRQRADLAIAAAVIFADAIVELTLIHLSLFRYLDAAWLPVPLWLAPLWGGLALSLRRLLGAGTAAPAERLAPTN